MNKLIIGCGYLGRRVASRWLARGHTVHALTRGREAELKALGIQPIRGDVRELLDLADLQESETILYAVAPGRNEGQTPEEVWLGGMGNLMGFIPEWKVAPRLIFISSTSVYGQTEGELVDESSATDPQEPAGLELLNVEEFLLNKWRHDGVILRFAGIYGPGRLLRSKAIQAGKPIIADPDKWLNLIYVEDGADVILAAEAHAQPGRIYNVSDGNPVRRRDFYARMADLLQAPPPRYVLPKPDELPPHESANRRVSNRRMLEELKVELRYPNYDAGLRASVRA
jgi:nucleoside-diphosphate-sugar epimerase